MERKAGSLSVFLSLVLILALLPLAAVPVRADSDAEELESLLGRGGVVTLAKDYSLSGEYILVPGDVTVTLDLKGHKLTGISLTVFGSLTIKDSGSGGSVTAYENSLCFDVGGGTLTLASGSINGQVRVYADVSNCIEYDDNGDEKTVHTVTPGRFIMSGGKITGGNGDCVSVSGSEFIFSGGTIEGGHTGIEVSSWWDAPEAEWEDWEPSAVYGKLVIDGGTVTDSIYNGVVVRGGSFTMKSGSIKDCGKNRPYNIGGTGLVLNPFTYTEYIDGNAVEAVCPTSFEMTGGTISGCKEEGVTVNGGVAFTFSGGAIEKNEDGIRLETNTKYDENNEPYAVPGELEISGGAVSENRSNGVVVNGGDFTMSSGSITCSGKGGEENTRHVGVVVGAYTDDRDETNLIWVQGTFDMSGGTISGGTISGGAGAGVEIKGGCAFTMSGGVISGHKGEFCCGVDANDVFSKEGSTFALSGGEIKDNTSGISVGSGSSLTMTGGTVSGNLNEGISIFGGSHTISKNAVISGNGGNGIELADGELKISGGEIKDNTENGVIFATMNKGSDPETGESIYGTGTLTITGGTISGNNFGVLCDGNCSKGSQIAIGGTASISGNQNAGISVGSGAKLTMTGGTVSGNGNGGVSFGDDTVFEMSGGSISNNTNKDSRENYRGYGVSVCGGSFTMSDGEISGNEGFNGGGGVYAAGAFTMTGGKIKNSIGDGVYVDGGTFTLSKNGEISGSSGNGVHVKSGWRVDNGKVTVTSQGTFNTSGGKISQNDDNGVNVDNYGAFTMSGGEISGNGGEENGYPRGDGIKVDSSGTFTPEKGTIKDNCASGISLGGNDLTINAGTVISGNFTGISGGGKLTMNGGEVSGNTVGVELSANTTYDYDKNDWVKIPSSLLLKGGSISGNRRGVEVSLDCTLDMPVGSSAVIAGNETGVDITGGEFTMSGGTVSGNGGDTLNSSNNAGVVVANSTIGSATVLGRFIMNGGSVSDSAYYGVQVYGGVFDMRGGSVTGSGYLGVELIRGGSLKMSGGSITGNGTSTENRFGGVRANRDCSVSLSGSATITDNINGYQSYSNSPRNLYIYDPVTVTGRLTGSIGVTLATPAPTTVYTPVTGVAAQSDGDYKLTVSDARAFTADEKYLRAEAVKAQDGSLQVELKLGGMLESVYGLKEGVHCKATAPAGSLLIMAEYENGRLVKLETISVEEDWYRHEVTIEPALPNGHVCKFMIVNASTYEPLCQFGTIGE